MYMYQVANVENKYGIQIYMGIEIEGYENYHQLISL